MSLTLIGTHGAAATTQGSGGAPPDDTILTRLSDALRRTGIRYCQWTGHTKRDRWSRGESDIDLLVDRTHHASFTAILARLGFKEAVPRGELRVPGVASYLAPEPVHGRMIHVHAHFRLVVTSPSGGRYHLPIEDVVLDSAVPCDPFSIPAPEYLYVLALIKLTLRHSLRDAVGRDEPRWLRAARAHIEHLEGNVRRPSLSRALARHIPEIADPGFVDRCMQMLMPGHSSWERIKTRMALQRRLTAHRQRPSPLAVLRRGARHLPMGRPPTGKRMANGGALIALVGADGAGKSTCSQALERWLAQELATRRSHLGLPTRSIPTLLAGTVLKVGRLLHHALGPRTSNLYAHLQLMRSICTARDRYLTYRRLRRAAAAGAIVIAERYPLPENRPLVGPSTVQGIALAARSRLASWLRRRERHYYARITRPDLILALRIDPETASRRKTTEPEAYVRARAQTMASVEWLGPRVRTVDANQPLAAVITDLKHAIWETL